MQSPATYTEHELIERLKAGERAAYSYLYDHYAAALFGVVLKIVGQTQAAEDILQDIFLKIYHNIDRYDGEKGRLYTWMLQIARNTAIDVVRSKEYRNFKQIRDLDVHVNIETDLTASSPSFDHLGLEKILSALDENQRKLIELAYYKGYTQEEISQELDQPLGTVKTHIRRTLQLLRKLLNIS